MSKYPFPMSAPEPRVQRYYMLNQGEAVKKKMDEPESIVHYWDGPRCCWVLVK